MTPELRATVADARLGNYHAIMRTTFFTFAAVGAVIQLGPDGYSAALTMLTISITAYGILAGGASLDDVAALRDDMDDGTAGTNFGRTVKARNTSMLKTISAVLIGLTGIAMLYGIFA